MQGYRSIKKLLLIFSGLAFAAVLLFALSLWFMQTANGQRWLLAKLQSVMAEKGTVVEFDQSQIDLFHEISLQNLRIKMQTATLAMDAQVEEFDIVYDIGFFPIRVDIAKLTLKGIHTDLSLQALSQDETPNGGLELDRQIANLFAMIPIEVRVEEYSLGPLAGSFKSTAKLGNIDKTTLVHFRNLVTQGRFAATEKQIAVKVEIDSKAAGDYLAITTDSDKTDPATKVPSQTQSSQSSQSAQSAQISQASQLQFLWNLGANVDLLFEKDQDIYRLTPKQLELGLEVSDLALDDSLKIGSARFVNNDTGNLFRWQWRAELEALMFKNKILAKPLIFGLGLETDKELSMLRLDLNGKYLGKAFFTSKLALLAKDPQGLKSVVHGDLQLQEMKGLLGDLGIVSELPVVSVPGIEVTWQLDRRGVAKDIVDFSSKPWADAEFNAKVEIKADAFALKDDFNVSESEFNFNIEQNSSGQRRLALNADFAVQPKTIKTSARKNMYLSKPLPLKISARSEAFSSAKVRVDWKVFAGDQEVLVVDSDYSQSEMDQESPVQETSSQKVGIKGLVDLHIANSYFVISKKFADMGAPKINFDLSSEFQTLKNKTVFEWPVKIASTLNWHDAVTKKPVFPSGSVAFSMEQKDNRRKAKMNLTAERVAYADVVRSAEVKGSGEFSHSGSDFGNNLDLQFSLNAVKTKIKLKSDESQGREYSTDTASLKLDVSSEGNVTRLKILELKIDQNTLAAKFVGVAQGHPKEYQLQGAIEGNIKNTFSLTSDQELKGQFRTPISVFFRGGNRLSLDGSLQFTDFFYNNRAQGISLTKVSGQIPFQEQLRLEKGGLKFQELVNLNAFIRVTFDRVEPLLSNSQPLAIQSIRYKGIDYGPLVIYMRLHQNLLQGQKFNLTLGSGQAGGEFYFDFNSAQPALGLLARLTNVVPREIFPASPPGHRQPTDKPITARMAIVYNVNARSLDGRIDVTQLGDDQLLSLMNVLDPEYINEQFNKMRTLLAYAYPKQLSMRFYAGLMDLDVDLNIANPVSKIRGIPISSFLTPYSRSISSQLKEIRLE